MMKLWYVKTRIHIVIAHAYNECLKTAKKAGNEKLAAICDQKWREHMNTGLDIMKRKLETM